VSVSFHKKEKKMDPTGHCSREGGGKEKRTHWRAPTGRKKGKKGGGGEEKKDTPETLREKLVASGHPTEEKGRGGAYLLPSRMNIGKKGGEFGHLEASKEVSRGIPGGKGMAKEKILNNGKRDIIWGGGRRREEGEKEGDLLPI